jgi:hypothetical protein
MQNHILDTVKEELTKLLRPVYAGIWEDLTIKLEVSPSLTQGEVRVQAGPGRIDIVGAGAADVLHGLYSYLEELGFLFTVNGPVFPEKTIPSLTTFSKTYKPYLGRRGIRQHINFPMDISSYPMWEAKEYIRNLARMRFNSLTFHQYLACGWFHLNMPEIGDSFAERKGRIHDYTYFYSEFHPVPNEPHLKAVIRNEHSFCPPEVEYRYGTKEARSFAYRFLGELIHEAKIYGFHVAVSTDIAASNMKDYFPQVKTHNRDLWVRATLEMLNQMTALYTEADDFELISPENTTLSSDDWEGDCRKFLAKLLPSWSKEKIEGVIKLISPEAEQYQKEGFLQILECIDVALETFKRAKASAVIGPRLAGKQLTVALYNGMPAISEANARILTAAVPEEYGLAWLPGHGAHTVDLRVKSMNLTAADRSRFRTYSWVEVDGFMYTPQFPRTGLQENIDFAAALPSRGVLFNHWRNAENELSLLFAAQAAYAGLRTEAFGPRVVKPYWGIQDDALLDQFLAKLEEVDALNSICGFCYLACWWEIDARKDMVVVSGPDFHEHTNDQRIQTTRRAIDLLDQLIAQSARPAGLRTMRFLRAVLHAAISHHQCATAMIRMAAYLKTIDKANPTTEQRQRFQALGDEALAHADAWLATMAAHCVDRGVEGNIVSYHHVVVGYIKGFQGLYGTIHYEAMPEYKVPSSLQAPPPLI